MNKLELMKTANEVRKGVVTAVHSAKSGHPGGSLSAADHNRQINQRNHNRAAPFSRKRRPGCSPHFTCTSNHNNRFFNE